MTLCQLAYTVAYTVARAATAGNRGKRCRCGSEGKGQCRPEGQ